MRNRLRHIFTAIMLMTISFTAYGQEAGSVTLITNVNVFDGVNEKLIKDADVLVEGHLIKQISENIDAPSGAEVIDAGGRTLIPGLIDAHWHATYAAIPVSIMMTGDISEMAIIGFLEAEKTLMRGFTSVRDMGGNPFAIKNSRTAGHTPVRGFSLPVRPSARHRGTSIFV